uniref:20 kDa chaperonin, chloroplastic n=1 Tax=Tetraselmis sp. GSL018 TaxID=582737 RepID=A0A061QYW8_9CHLO|mmetsp:Transcript_23992/g.57177  ORF Transcript_23992/g.57177 Transcript_23992/m.57177 type:complete len:224 (-) Transcript_23992:115-786(-)
MYTVRVAQSSSRKALSFSNQHTASRRRCISVSVRAAVSIPEKFKTVTPVGDRVYVRLGAEEAATSSGILLPSSAVKRPNQGEVVAVGKDSKLSTGEQVMFAKYAGTEVSVGDDEYVLLTTDDVIGTMPSNKIAELKPTGNRILVKVVKGEEQTRGGIMLSSKSEQKTIGKIVAVGPGTEETPMTLSVGQDVLYPSYGGMELEGDEDDEAFVVLRDEEVLAVLS